MKEKGKKECRKGRINKYEEVKIKENKTKKKGSNGEKSP